MAEKKPLTEVLSILETGLAPRGFVKTGGMLQIVNEFGDVGLIELQKSRFSDGPRLYFYVELGVLPLAWADWIRTGRNAKVRPTEGLWRHRLNGPSMEQFEVSPRVTAQAAAADILQRLDTELPTMIELLDRDVFLAKARRGLFTGMTNNDAARLVLTLDSGEEEAVTAEFDWWSRSPTPSGSFNQRFLDWARGYR